MALVVEDGTGLANANSYVSLAEVDAHHADVGVPSGYPSDQGDQEALAIEATRYLDDQFGSAYIGVFVIATTTQALLWGGREEVKDAYGRVIAANSVPAALKRAVFAVIAARAGGVTLYASGSQVAGGEVIRKKTKVEDLEIDVTYSEGSTSSLTSDGVTRVPAAEDALKPILKTTPGASGLASDWALRA